MRPPLVPWTRAAAAVAVGGLVVLVGLGLLVRGTDHGIGPDDAINRWIHVHFDEAARIDMVRLTDIPVVVVAVAIIAVVALVRRRADVAVLAIAAPLVSVGLTEWVFKPLFGRTNPIAVLITHSAVEAYPSGHESATAAVLVVLAVLVLRAAWPLVARVGALAALTAYFVVTVLGLVGQFYHYFTDTIGALALAVAVVLGGALALDRVGSRTSR